MKSSNEIIQLEHTKCRLDKRYFKDEELRKNFNELISTLNINIAELSRSSSYDSSFLSKIRIGNINTSMPKTFIETMLGLESWLPIYMTGQISPYFF